MDKGKETEKAIKNNNDKGPIFNMICLHTGNFAVSMKEAIEIYDFRKLNLIDKNNMTYNNQQIQESNCLLQRINLVKSKKINYVYEFPDNTLLCATYSKIFRLELTNNDFSHNIIGKIELEPSELPTQLISLGESLLVILSEKKSKCSLKVFIKNNGSGGENKLSNYRMSETQSIDSNDRELSEKEYNSNDFSDVPPIGKSLFSAKDIEIDSDFHLLRKNINKDCKLFLSMYEIKKIKKEENKNNINIIDDEYLYEFIVTSNKVYNLGDNRINFYGVKKIDTQLYFAKIKVITNISCSIQVNSICQISDKYVCIGLQNHDLKGQISGFAIIDVYTREICRIIRDQEISGLYYSLKSELLFASMEVRDKKKNCFMTKIYKIEKNFGDRGEEEIDFKKIFEYNNKHIDTISSVAELKPLCFRFDTEQEGFNDNIIFVTSSHDSTLEVVKTNIKI